MDKKNDAITSRDVDFAKWYTDVCRKAELMDYSPVKGPEGNIEYLMFVEKSAAPVTLGEETAAAVVAASHQALDR